MLADFFSRLYHFDQLIAWGGHAVLIAIVFAETGIMAGFFLPGDSLLVSAGILAAAGHLSVTRLLVELTLAAIAGDALGYWMGRRWGPSLFNKEESMLFRRSHLERTRRFFEKYGAKAVVIARFVPIVRTFTPVLAGVGQMPYRTFAFYNVVGGLGWVHLTVLAGYFLGRAIPSIGRHLHLVIGIVILLSLVPIFLESLKSRDVK